MPQDGPPPRLRSNTLRQRAAASGQLWEARQRARREVADAFDTPDVQRDDIPIERRDGTLAPTDGFFEYAEPREAAFDLNPEFPRQDIGFQDVERVDDGFRASEPVRRRSAAFDFEEQTALADVDPFGDLQPVDGGGFGLTEGAQLDLGAERLDTQLPGLDIGREDVRLAGDEVVLRDEVYR